MPVVIFLGIPRFWKKLLFYDSFLDNAHPPDNLRKMFAAKAGFKVKKDFPAIMPLISWIHARFQVRSGRGGLFQNAVKTRIIS